MQMEIPIRPNMPGEKTIYVYDAEPYLNLVRQYVSQMHRPYPLSDELAEFALYMLYAEVYDEEEHISDIILDRFVDLDQPIEQIEADYKLVDTAIHEFIGQWLEFHGTSAEPSYIRCDGHRLYFIYTQ